MWAHVSLFFLHLSLLFLSFLHKSLASLIRSPVLLVLRFLRRKRRKVYEFDHRIFGSPAWSCSDFVIRSRGFPVSSNPSTWLTHNEFDCGNGTEWNARDMWGLNIEVKCQKTKKIRSIAKKVFQSNQDRSSHSFCELSISAIASTTLKFFCNETHLHLQWHKR